jgi:hypothetical protein
VWGVVLVVVVVGATYGHVSPATYFDYPAMSLDLK